MAETEGTLARLRRLHEELTSPAAPDGESHHVYDWWNTDGTKYWTCSACGRDFRDQPVHRVIDALPALLDVAEGFARIAQHGSAVYDHDDIGDCIFCGSDLWARGVDADPDNHADDCPWMQATAALAALDTREAA